MHSAEDPDNDNTRWVSISHDNSSAVIDSGYGNITLDDTTKVAGNLELADNVVGEEGFYVWYNGTVLGMVSPDRTKWSCWVDNAGSWVCE